MEKNPNWRLTTYKRFDKRIEYKKHAKEVLALVHEWKSTNRDETLNAILQHPRVFKTIEKFVNYYYNTYKDLYLEKEDLRQEGTLGFFEGLRKYKLPEDQIPKEGRDPTSPFTYCTYWVRRNMNLLIKKIIINKTHIPTVPLEEEILGKEVIEAEKDTLEILMPHFTVLEYYYLLLKLNETSKATDIEICRGLNISNKVLIPNLKRSIQKKIIKLSEEGIINVNF